MAKRRAKKPHKKQEQPWLAAARDKLREKAATREKLETTQAFLELAMPGIQALGAGAGVAEVRLVLERARFTWNLPILHALSTEPESEDAEIRADAEPWLAHLADHLPALTPLFARRTGELDAHRRPIAAVFAHELDGEIALGVSAGDDIGSADVLGIGETGWPKASHSLLALFEPLHVLLPEDYTQEQGEQAIALAVVAWNLPVVDRAGLAIPEARRHATREGARRAREQPEPRRAAFEAMVEARRTRFAYDPRVIVATRLTVAGAKVHVQAVALGGGPAAPGSRSIGAPARKVKRAPAWLSSVRDMLRGG